MMFIKNNFEKLALKNSFFAFYFNLGEEINSTDALNNFGNLADYSTLTLVIALGLFAGIIKIGKLYRTNIYLLTAIAIVFILAIKQIQIINFRNFLEVFQESHRDDILKDVVLNSFFDNDLMLLFLAEIIVSILAVGVFALIVFLAWLFQENTRFFTATTIIGLLFLFIINYFFNDMLAIIRSDLWVVFFGLMDQSHIFLPKVIRIIYQRICWLFLNAFIMTLTQTTFFDDLFFYLLFIAAVIAFMLLFISSLTFLAILLLGLFIIRVAYLSILFLTIFICVYIFLFFLS